MGKKPLKAFRCGANVVGYRKDGKRFGMTCAWAMMIDYSKVALLLGGQADTSKNLTLGQEIGISALSTSQASISANFGRGHSLSRDKFAFIDFEEKGEAILIKGAKVKMWGQVSGIQDFDGDKLAFIEVKDYEQDDGLDFLDGYDPKAY